MAATGSIMGWGRRTGSGPWLCLSSRAAPREEFLKNAALPSQGGRFARKLTAHFSLLHRPEQAADSPSPAPCQRLVTFADQHGPHCSARSRAMSASASGHIEIRPRAARAPRRPAPTMAIEQADYVARAPVGTLHFPTNCPIRWLLNCCHRTGAVCQRWTWPTRRGPPRGAPDTGPSSRSRSRRRGRL